MTANPMAQTEGGQLDAISGEEAKAILFQLGYYDPETIFMSFHFSYEEFQHVQESISIAGRGKHTPEWLISALCEQDVLDHRAKQV